MAMPPSSVYKTLDIAGRGALVTGTTSGIGKAIAVRLAELGCHVVLIGRRADRLEALKAELKTQFPNSPEAFACPLDVTDTEAIKALPSKLKAAGVPEIDILVNNAGMAIGVNSVDANEIEECRQVLAVNVLGVMAMVSTFAPSMKERGVGHIINISSVAGHECYTGGSVYCASKHAVNAFTIAARHDLAGTPIRVTAISPGLVETEFSQVRFGGDANKAKKVYEDILPMYAEDVADQVVYAATRPRHVQIADVISYCTNQGHAKYVVERKGESLGAPKSSVMSSLRKSISGTSGKKGASPTKVEATLPATAESTPAEAEAAPAEVAPAAEAEAAPATETAPAADAAAAGQSTSPKQSFFSRFTTSKSKSTEGEAEAAVPADAEATPEAETAASADAAAPLTGGPKGLLKGLFSQKKSG